MKFSKDEKLFLVLASLCGGSIVAFPGLFAMMTTSLFSPEIGQDDNLDELLAAVIFALGALIIAAGLFGLHNPKVSAIALMILVIVGIPISLFIGQIICLGAWIFPASLVIVGAKPILAKISADDTKAEQEANSNRL
jgi:hypothetical protein